MPLPATSHYNTCSSRTAAADSSTSSNPKTRNKKQTNRIPFLHAHTRAHKVPTSSHSLTHSLTHPKIKNSSKNSWIPKSISKKASQPDGGEEESKRNTHHDALVLSSSQTGSQILQKHTPPRFLTQRPRIRVADSGHKKRQE